MRPVRVTKTKKETQKKKYKEETLLWHKTGYSPRPPMSSDRNQILRGVDFRDSSKFQVSSKLVKWFPKCEVEIDLSHRFGCWLIQQCTAVETVIC